MTARNEVTRQRPDTAPHARRNHKPEVQPVFHEKLHHDSGCDEEHEEQIPDCTMSIDRKRSKSAAVQQAEFRVSRKIRRDAERKLVRQPDEEIEANEKSSRDKNRSKCCDRNSARRLPFLSV